MSCATVRSDLDSFVQKIMDKEDVPNYEIEITGNSGKGENYLGEVIFFTVTTDKGKKYHLVMKTAKRSLELRNTMNVESAYRRESLMYSKVIPEIEKFLDDVNCDLKVDFVPKIYWICDESNRETLIMENLKTRGFRHWDRRKPMDLNHALFVLKHFGKYHAFTMAMRMTRRERFETLAKDLNGVWQEFMKTIDGKVLFGSCLKNALGSLEKNGREDLMKKFKIVEDDLERIIHAETSVEDRLVITHGDSWINNVFLQYEGENASQPTKLCFVDFQLAGHDSPVRDLSYFIYTACDKSVLDRFDLLLEEYHSSLSENLKILGCNVEDILTLPQLKEHWKKYGSFGLILSTMIVKVELFDSDEAPDLTDIYESGASLTDALTRTIKNEEEYIRRMFDLLTHFGDKFL